MTLGVNLTELSRPLLTDTNIALDEDVQEWEYFLLQDSKVMDGDADTQRW